MCYYNKRPNKDTCTWMRMCGVWKWGFPIGYRTKPITQRPKTNVYLIFYFKTPNVKINFLKWYC